MTKSKVKISYEDFLAWCDEDTRAEWVDGEIIKDSRYHLIPPDAADVYHSEVVKDFWLRVSWLWEETLPPILEVCRELGLLN